MEPIRLLVVAHEFPPIPSAQSLRMAYFVREFSSRGMEITVLCPDSLGYGGNIGLPDTPLGVNVVRTFPGLLSGYIARRMASSTSVVVAPEDARAETPVGRAEEKPAFSKWKRHFFRMALSAYSWLQFPDVRAEWNPWAKTHLRRLLKRFNPHVVLCSHEPASCLRLGLLASRAGFPVVMDLGDPVLARYTPLRWRWVAMKLEAAICRSADALVVTSEATARLLEERHRGCGARVHVVTQGFESQPVAVDCSPVESADVELLYTGSLYEFRRIDSLLEAVLSVPGIVLNVATMNPPLQLTEAARNFPDRVRLLGFIGHSDALKAQRRAHVLVNIANAQEEQVPGKIYEYLGAKRTILHLTDNSKDAGALLLERTGAGFACENSLGPITQALRTLVAAHLSAGVGSLCVRKEETIGRYEWKQLAEVYERTILKVVRS